MGVKVTVNEFAFEGGFLGIKDSSFQTAVAIAAEAKALAPVDEGQLRNTIMATNKEIRAPYKALEKISLPYSSVPKKLTLLTP